MKNCHRLYTVKACQSLDVRETGWLICGSRILDVFYSLEIGEFVIWVFVKIGIWDWHLRSRFKTLCLNIWDVTGKIRFEICPSLSAARSDCTLTWTCLSTAQANSVLWLKLICRAPAVNEQLDNSFRVLRSHNFSLRSAPDVAMYLKIPSNVQDDAKINVQKSSKKYD